MVGVWMQKWVYRILDLFDGHVCVSLSVVVEGQGTVCGLMGEMAATEFMLKNMS